jgi:glutaminyl-peptide cyclotransferase
MPVVTSTVGYAVCTAFLLATAGPKADAITSMWSGDQAMNDIATQLSFGTRALGTDGHEEAAEFIKNQLASTSTQAVTQQGTYQGTDGKEHPLTNIIARFDPSNPRRVIVGTHYDSIIRAYAEAIAKDLARQERCRLASISAMVAA